MDLYISDLDGTLLNSEAKISSQTAEIINDLIEKGLNFTVATARSLYTSKNIIEPLNLKLPIALFNGIIIFDPIKKKYLIKNFLFKDKFDHYIELFEQFGAYPVVCTKDNNGIDHIYYKRTSKAVEFFINSRLKNGDERFRHIDDFSICKSENLVNIFAINVDKIIQPLYDVLKTDKSIYCQYSNAIYTENNYYMEIYNKKGNKKHAIEFLKQNLGIERVICFGDNQNDIPMFEASDEKYAVSNAHTDLKKMATEIIGKNDEDSVALFIKKHFLKE
ncbi:MAG: HAD family hydrolase [archaeon]|nr:HAD family hydrolase [archaeon]